MPRPNRLNICVTLLLAASWLPARADGVADPVAAIRALYASAANGGKPGLAQIYALAGRSLRTHLMGAGLCTYPMRTRALTCLDTIDPIGNGVVLPRSGVAVAGAASDEDIRQVIVTFTGSTGTQVLHYAFVRSGGGWTLDNIAALTAPAWELTSLDASGPQAPQQQPQPLAVDAPRASAE